MRQRKQPVTFPSLAASNLVSLCAIFTDPQASLVILAGLLATNNSPQGQFATWQASCTRYRRRGGAPSVLTVGGANGKS